MGRRHLEDTPTARTHLRGNGHLYMRTLGREHMTGTDTDTSMGHVTYVTAGYLYLGMGQYEKMNTTTDFGGQIYPHC